MVQAGTLTWQRSRKCESTNCVEVARTQNAVKIRDGKDPAGPMLTFTAPAWGAFVKGVQAGEFEAAPAA